MSVNAGFPTSKNVCALPYVAVAAPLADSTLILATPRPDKPGVPFRHFSLKITTYVPLYICERRENTSKTRFQNNARTRRAAGRRRKRRYIFIGRLRCSIDSLQARRKDPSEREKERERERGGGRASPTLSTVIIEDGVVDPLSSCSLESKPRRAWVTRCHEDVRMLRKASFILDLVDNSL